MTDPVQESIKAAREAVRRNRERMARDVVRNDRITAAAMFETGYRAVWC